MGLIDDLRTVAANLDPSLQPSANEAGPLVGALIAYTEHGDKVLKAAEGDNGPAAVSELLTGAKADKADEDKAGQDPKAAAKPASSSGSGSK